LAAATTTERTAGYHAAVIVAENVEAALSARPFRVETAGT